MQEENVHDLELHKGFSMQEQKHDSEKEDKLKYINTKSFCSMKDTVKKIFVYNISDQMFILRIYKNSQQSNNRNLVKQFLTTYLTKEDIWMTNKQEKRFIIITNQENVS